MKTFEIDTVEKAIARFEQGKLYFETNAAEKAIALIKAVLKLPVENELKYLRISKIKIYKKDDTGEGFSKYGKGAIVDIKFSLWKNTPTVHKTGFHDSTQLWLVYIHEEHHDRNRREEISNEIFALLHDERVKIEEWSPTRYLISKAVPFFLDNPDRLF